MRRTKIKINSSKRKNRKSYNFQLSHNNIDFVLFNIFVVRVGHQKKIVNKKNIQPSNTKTDFQCSYIRPKRKRKLSTKKTKKKKKSFVIFIGSLIRFSSVFLTQHFPSFFLLLLLPLLLIAYLPISIGIYRI